MRIINIIKMFYVISADETTIIYEYKNNNSRAIKEGHYTFKGRFEKPRTESNVLEFLKSELKGGIKE